MNIGVLVKASLDGNMIRASPDGDIDVEATPLAISEYDRNAVAEAVRIKNELGEGKITIFSVLTWGPVDKKTKELENVMREALALGGDEAYAVIDEGLIPGEVSQTAEVLAALINKVGKPDLILTGEASMDMLTSQLPIRLAYKLGYSVATFARKIEISDGKLKVTRDLEDRLEVTEINLPAVVSVTGEINNPRLPTLLQIRKSFAKPYNVLKLSDLEAEVKKLINIERLELVTIMRKNIILKADKLEDAAEELINKLIEEGVLKV